MGEPLEGVQRSQMYGKLCGISVVMHKVWCHIMTPFDELNVDFMIFVFVI